MGIAAIQSVFPLVGGNLPLSSPKGLGKGLSQAAPARKKIPTQFEKDVTIRFGTKHLKLHAQVYRPKKIHKNSQTFVLVHGFMANRAAYARLAPLLQKNGHTVYAIDLPGHGRSDRPDWFNYSDPDSYIYALRAFMKKAKLKDVHLVGHSMGGGLSTYFALKHPKQISKLTLLSPWSDTIAISWLGNTLPFLTRGALGLWPSLNMKRGLRNTSWDRSYLRDNELMKKLLEPIDRKDTNVDFADLLQKTVEMDWDKLQKALTPKNIARLKKKLGTVRIYYGERDPLIPEGQVEDLTKVLGAKLITVENVGHVLPSEAPEVAHYITGSKLATEDVIAHQRKDLPEKGKDLYGGPYFQWGVLRGGSQFDLKFGDQKAFFQTYIQTDTDHPGPLEFGLEFGLQGSKSWVRSDGDISGFAQPKFYWFRNTWFEASSGLTPSGGVGSFQESTVAPYHSLDGQLLKMGINLMNSGFLLDFFSSLNTNIYHTELPSDRDFLERSYIQAGIGGAL